MKVKRSKDLVGGVKLEPITISSFYLDPEGSLEVKVPNRYAGGRGYSSMAFTKKEARRLASALLKYTESMK